MYIRWFISGACCWKLYFNAAYVNEPWPQASHCCWRRLWWIACRCSKWEGKSYSTDFHNYNVFQMVLLYFFLLMGLRQIQRFILLWASFASFYAQTFKLHINSSRILFDLHGHIISCYIDSWRYKIWAIQFYILLHYEHHCDVGSPWPHPHASLREELFSISRNKFVATTC